MTLPSDGDAPVSDHRGAISTARAGNELEPSVSLYDADGTVRWHRQDEVLAADLLLQCARLRVTADEAYAIDPAWWLSAQLRDFADLLEVADWHGWWTR